MAEPLSTTAKLAISAAVSSAVSSVQQAAQQKAQARLARHQQAQQIALRDQERQVQEKQQREQARLHQARARAAFGARGVSSAGGSANALVDGISSRTEQAIADDRRLFDLGVENLRNNQRFREKESLLNTRNNILSTVANTGGGLITDSIREN